MAKEQTVVESLVVRLCEERNLWIVHDSIDINVDEYPQLKGMTQDEMQDYIKQNASDMQAPSSCDWADSLYDALYQQDVVREKDSGGDAFVYFE